MRKFISVLLALLLVFSLTTVAFSAYNVVDEGVVTIEEALAAAEYDGPIARVYFMMPNGHNGDFGSDGTQPVSWLNDYNLLDGVHYAGIYWWGGPGACSSWPGYRMEVDNVEECIYYADIPGDDNVTTVVFSNGVDGGMDADDPIYDKANQVSDVNVEGADEGDYDTIPLGTWHDMDADDYQWDFDGFIYIVDQDQVDENPVNHRLLAGGNWYAYYGNGCYGNYAEYQEGFVSVDENCLNPNHFDEDGNHVGYHEDEPATEPAGHILGDVNDDDLADSVDATFIQRYDVEMSLPEAVLANINAGYGDVNSDDDTDIVDVTLIQRYDLNPESVKFPIGEPIKG